VRRRRLDHVLARKLDGPFRSTLHCLRTLEELAHRGVGFACLTQELDTTSPTGRLPLTIPAAVAEISQRWFRVRDTYGVQVTRGTIDPLLAIAMAVAIDMLRGAP